MTTSSAAAPKPTPRAFAHQAARASWVAPLLGGFLGSFVRNSSAGGIIADLFTMLFVFTGIVLACIALAGIPKHGKKGILVPAIIGLALNGLLIMIFVSNFTASRGR